MFSSEWNLNHRYRSLEKIICGKSVPQNRPSSLQYPYFPSLICKISISHRSIISSIECGKSLHEHSLLSSRIRSWVTALYGICSENPNVFDTPRELCNEKQDNIYYFDSWTPTNSSLFEFWLTFDNKRAIGFWWICIDHGSWVQGAKKCIIWCYRVYESIAMLCHLKARWCRFRPPYSFLCAQSIIHGCSDEWRDRWISFFCIDRIRCWHWENMESEAVLINIRTKIDKTYWKKEV